MAAPAASVLCIKTVAGGIDIPEEFPRGSAPGTRRPGVLELAAAQETSVSDMRSGIAGDGILDVVPAPAEGAGGRCAAPGIFDVV